MTETFYPAIIDKDADSDYGVTFPDFPGCVSAGDTIEEAVTMARDALGLHIQGEIEDGREIPVPRPFDAIALDPDLRVVCIVLIPASIPTKSKRINITIDERLLAQIDAITTNRSGWLAEAARRVLHP
ncbi:antitoxin HicB [uncultured Gammaproteobacteria bacterium]